MTILLFHLIIHIFVKLLSTFAYTLTISCQFVAVIFAHLISFCLPFQQIKSESFLEDINNILNSGDVPNIYGFDELEQIYTEMKPIVQDSGLQPTKTNLFSAYTKRVRNNLHTVLTMRCDLCAYFWFLLNVRIWMLILLWWWFWMLKLLWWLFWMVWDKLFTFLFSWWYFIVVMYHFSWKCERQCIVALGQLSAKSSISINFTVVICMLTNKMLTKL